MDEPDALRSMVAMGGSSPSRTGGDGASDERGWEGLDLEPDETVGCALNYT